MRDVRWREGGVFERITADDMKRHEKFGLRVYPRMAILDNIRMINHALANGIGKDLLWCQCPRSLSRMPVAGVRYWNLVQRRWYRVAEEQCRAHKARAATDPGVVGGGALILPEGDVELPDQLFKKDPSKIAILMLTLDQEQCQWSACHCMAAPGPHGFGLFVHFRGDQIQNCPPNSYS